MRQPSLPHIMAYLNSDILNCNSVNFINGTMDDLFKGAAVPAPVLPAARDTQLPAEDAHLRAVTAFFPGTELSKCAFKWKHTDKCGRLVKYYKCSLSNTWRRTHMTPS